MPKKWKVIELLRFDWWIKSEQANFTSKSYVWERATGWSTQLCRECWVATSKNNVNHKNAVLMEPVF